MAASDEDEYGDFERGKSTESKQPTEEVKNTVKEDRGGVSVRDKAKDFKQQAVDAAGKGQEKLAPVLASAKEKLDKVDGKRPQVQEEAKQMLDQAKHTVGRVVHQESKDVVEGMKRLAKDEKAFHEAAHKVAEKVTGATSSGKDDSNENNEQEHREHQQQHRHHHDFSDFSEMEEDLSDEAEGSNHPKQHLLNQQRDQQHHQHHHPPEHKHKRKKSPLGYFKFGAKHAGKEKGKNAQDQKHSEQEQQNGDKQHGVLGSIRSVFGEGSQGQISHDIASGLAQKKLGQMRHVVDAEMDEAGNVTAAEKKTQGVGLVQSFVCLCTCASSVHVHG